MTVPTLHVPLKDSPVSLLITGVNDTETVLELSDVSDFAAANITRLTLGFNEEETETVEVVGYEEDPSGTLTGEVTVIRGSDPLAWPSGTWVSRVFTAADLSEVHQYLEHLRTEHVVVPAQIENRTRRVFIPLVIDTLDSGFSISRYGVPLPPDATTNFYAMGMIPDDYVGDGEIIGLIVGGLVSDTGSARIIMDVSYAQILEDTDHHWIQNIYTTIPMNPLVENQIKVTSAIELVDASPGDILTVRIGRVGNDPLDTAIAYVYAKGAILSYTADS